MSGGGTAASVSSDSFDAVIVGESLAVGIGRHHEFMSQHLNLTQVAGDGHCGYASIIASCGLNDSVSDLREWVACTLDDTTELCSVLVTPNLSSVSAVAPPGFAPSYASIDSYKAGIRGDLWIDSIVLKMIAMRFGRSIVILEDGSLPILISSVCENITKSGEIYPDGDARSFAVSGILETSVVCEKIPRGVFLDPCTIYLKHTGGGTHYDSYSWPDEIDLVSVRHDYLRSIELPDT